MYKVFNFHKEAAEDKQFTLEMYQILIRSLCPSSFNVSFL